MTAVDDHIESLDAAIKPLFLDVRETILQAKPGLDQAIKWGNCLTYSAGTNVIQTIVGKNKVSLVFFQGTSLDDPKGLLTGKGKEVRTMRVISPDFDRDELQSFVRQAVRLARADT
jgi:hypothetical protein